MNITEFITWITVFSIIFIYLMRLQYKIACKAGYNHVAVEIRNRAKKKRIIRIIKLCAVYVLLLASEIMLCLRMLFLNLFWDWWYLALAIILLIIFIPLKQQGKGKYDCNNDTISRGFFYYTKAKK